MTASHRALWVATIVGVVASVAAGLALGAKDLKVAEVAFESQAADSLMAITGQMNSSSDVLYTLRQFVELDDAPVTRTAFQAFASRSRVRETALRDSGYAARIAESDRARFEAETRLQGAPGFYIREPDASGTSRPAPSREVYYPILYPDPVEIAPRVLGLNLTFERRRREAIAQAIATGRPAATPPLQIVTGAGRIGGFMSFLPVYRPGGTKGEPSGLVYGVFEIAPMIEGVLKNTLRSGEINVLFFDPRQSGETIYWHPAANRAPGLRGLSLGEALVRPHWSGTVEMAGQSWGIVLLPEHAGEALWRRRPALVATGLGLLLTAGVDIYLIVSRRRTARLVRLTADLQAAARSLTEKSDRLAHLAQHDFLTGLPNRGSLLMVLNERLHDPAKPRVAVVSLDLDGFKAVNDTHGHATGDALLMAVADRLRTVIGNDGIAARFGGDEFVLLFEPVAQGTATDLCRRCLERMCEPFDILGLTIAIGASIGICFAPDDGLTARELLKKADIALYRSKAEGRGTYRIFAPDKDTALRDPRQPPEPQWEPTSGRPDGMRAA